MVKVKTVEGEIECPEVAEIGPRTKFWASAMRDLVRTEEEYCVMAAALKEAYEAGRIEALKELMFNLAGRAGEVIDVEATLVEAEADKREGEGSQPDEPAAADQADGSVEPPTSPAELPGGLTEGTRSVLRDDPEVEETP